MMYVEKVNPNYEVLGDSFRRDLVGVGVIGWKWERMAEVHRKRRRRVRIMEQRVTWPHATKESKENKKMSNIIKNSHQMETDWP